MASRSSDVLDLDLVSMTFNHGMSLAASYQFNQGTEALEACFVAQSNGWHEESKRPFWITWVDVSG